MEIPEGPLLLRLESVDVEPQAQQARHARWWNLEERKRGVRNIEIEPFVLRPEQRRCRPIETVAGRQDRLRRAIRGDAHNRVERIGAAIEIAAHVEREVVAENAGSMR